MRAVVVAQDGASSVAAVEPYRTFVPDDGAPFGREFEPHELQESLFRLIAAAGEGIAAIAFTGQALRHGASRVVKVDLVIGALAGIEPDALTFCFPAAAAGTACEGAELSIEIELARGRCSRCAQTSDVRDLMSPCPACGAWPLGIEGGREMRLRSLEVG